MALRFVFHIEEVFFFPWLHSPA